MHKSKIKDYKHAVGMEFLTRSERTPAKLINTNLRRVWQTKQLVISL